MTKPNLSDYDTVKCLPALLCDKPEILILGIVPGRESIEKQEYYANPNNHMWELLAKACGGQVPATYPDKVAFLARNHIAMWDYYSSVMQKKGSSRAEDILFDLDYMQDNGDGIKKILESNPSIKKIAINGRSRNGGYDDIRRVVEQICAEFPNVKVEPYPATNGSPKYPNADSLWEEWQNLLK